MKEGQAPIWTLRKNIPGVSSTWHDYQVDQVIEDLIHHVLQVHDKPATEEEVSGERERDRSEEGVRGSFHIVILREVEIEREIMLSDLSMRGGCAIKSRI